MADMTPTPEDLTRDLRADLAALLRATPKAQWEWGEDDLWDFVHYAKAAGVAGARRALAAESCLAEIRDAMTEYLHHDDLEDSVAAQSAWSDLMRLLKPNPSKT